MTREEFLAFDTSKFYEPGYEEHLAYMNYLTGLFMLAINDSDEKYDTANSAGDEIGDNAAKAWIMEKNAKKPVYKEDPGFPKKEGEFIEAYAYYLKDFLADYHSNIRTIKKAEEKSQPYFSYETKNEIFKKLLGDKRQTKDIVQTFISQTLYSNKNSFIDLRILTAYQMDHKYDETDIEKNHLHYLFTFTLNDLAEKLNTKKTKENSRKF